MTRLTAQLLHRAGATGDADGYDADDTVTLDYETRFLRRKLLVTDAGVELMVDLPETVSANAGDAFETPDGRRIAVRAAAEPLLAVAADGATLARLAWHIGNRHTPAQIEPGRLLIRADDVLANMLAHLGAKATPVTEPFSPEGGAYGLGRTHGHEHEHENGHSHSHPG